jgi:hypothetical protein
VPDSAMPCAALESDSACPAPVLLARTPRRPPPGYLSRCRPWDALPEIPCPSRHPAMRRRNPSAAAVASSSRSSSGDAQGGEEVNCAACGRPRALHRPKLLAGLRRPCRAAPPRLCRDRRPCWLRLLARFALMKPAPQTVARSLGLGSRRRAPLPCAAAAARRRPCLAAGRTHASVATGSRSSGQI